jgi:hypothetical protein
VQIAYITDRGNDLQQGLTLNIISKLPCPEKSETPKITAHRGKTQQRNLLLPTPKQVGKQKQAIQATP